MTTEKKIVLSASRRSDIPAFYMDWFMTRLDEGVFEVQNPYSGRISRIPATPEKVHTIVFWSKDFGPFIRGGYGDFLVRRGYHLFFNFTINSECFWLEPGVPPLPERLDQLAYLCRHFSPRSILWRFDPICIFKTPEGTRSDNLNDFTMIADEAHRLGVSRCVTSFMDLYPKVQKRAAAAGISFHSPPLAQQKKILLRMQSHLERKQHPIALHTCCEKELLGTLPPHTGVRPGACVPGDLLVELYGEGISLKKDTGQRIGAGCGCKVSSDIGSYRRHPCYHNCLFCYANPAARPSAKNTGRHQKRSAAG